MVNTIHVYFVKIFLLSFEKKNVHLNLLIIRCDGEREDEVLASDYDFFKNNKSYSFIIFFL